MRIFLTVLALVFLIACESKPKEPRLVTPQELVGLQTNGFAILVDARTDQSQKLQGSVNVQEWKKQLRRDQEVVFVSDRESQAKELAQQAIKDGLRAAVLSPSSADQLRQAGLFETGP